jgi:enoyl-CoA hydratase/carnithine racemase
MAKVLYEKRDNIAYVTLNRPEAMNAIDLGSRFWVQGPEVQG